MSPLLSISSSSSPFIVLVTVQMTCTAFSLFMFLSALFMYWLS